MELLKTILRQFSALVWNVMTDVSRHPPFVILVAGCIALILGLPILSIFTLGEEMRMVRDGAMAATLLIGIFAGVAASSSAVYGEITSGTILFTLSKNVSRTLYLIAVFCGISLMMICFFAAIMPVIFISMKMTSNGIITDWRYIWFILTPILLALIMAAILNFKLKKNFYSKFFLYLTIFNIIGGFAAECLIKVEAIPYYYTTFSPEKTILSAAFILMLLMVGVSFSIMCVTFVSPKTVFALSSLFMVIGLISEYLKTQYGPIIKAFLFFIPDWQLFWVMDSSKITFTYFSTCLLYAAIFVGIYLTFGALIFNKRDLTAGRTDKMLI
jgi:hypothetical protein